MDRAVDEAPARQGGERAASGRGFDADPDEDLVERGGRAATGEAKEGAEDGDLGAHGCHYVQH
jgi:hypothetical protein